MTKSEFLDEMRIALTGRMDTASINDNIRYYEDYIVAEIRQGKNESEVMDSLGDANALAISLIDAYEREHPSENSDKTSSYSSSSTTETEEKVKTPFWAKLLSFFISHPIISIVIIVGIILLLVILAIWLAISILTQIWPILLILLLAGLVGFLVYGLIKLIKKS